MPPKAKAVPTPAVLTTISEQHRMEYIRRSAYLEGKEFEAKAAASYLDALGEQFREFYGLPVKYDLNLETGEVTEANRDDSV